MEVVNEVRFLGGPLQDHLLIQRALQAFDVDQLLGEAVVVALPDVVLIHLVLFLKVPICIFKLDVVHVVLLVECLWPSLLCTQELRLSFLLIQLSHRLSLIIGVLEGVASELGHN